MKTVIQFLTISPSGLLGVTVLAEDHASMRFDHEQLVYRHAGLASVPASRAWTRAMSSKK